MARGWESKAVEAQQETASTRAAPQPAVAPDEAARRARLATLRLARARATADLEAATASAHRAMLEQAIADLDRQIASLTSTAATPQSTAGAIAGS
ncbi:MAG TPA: hypothetical protein VGQ10_16140 [Vicinamibacterales bacterium]|jgi:hypothetical protein|nr:hypothetical protein [Vicinamibacterales bacterium]